MAAGTLKMRNTDRGFGFVQNDADVFLHVTALQVSGIDIDEIRKGIRLTYEIENTRDGKTKAGSVRLASEL